MAESGGHPTTAGSVVTGTVDRLTNYAMAHLRRRVGGEPHLQRRRGRIVDDAAPCDREQRNSPDAVSSSNNSVSRKRAPLLRERAEPPQPHKITARGIIR